MLPFEPSDLVLVYSLRRYLGGGSDEVDKYLRWWTVDAQAHDEDGELSLSVGTVSICMVDPGEVRRADRSLLALLDGESGDLSKIAAAVFLSDDADPPFDPDNTLLIVDRVKIKPAYRGHGLGPLMVAHALLELATPFSFAALAPAPIGGDHDDESRARACDALARTWERVGFEPWRDEVWVLDLTTATLEETAPKLLAEAARATG